MDKTFKTLAVFTTLIMFILMIAGALVTNTGSQLGCGNDWPLCKGKLIPSYTIGTMIEYTHRLITGFAGILVIIFSVWAWIKYKSSKEVKILSIMGIAFIILESLLGASAVIWPQSPSALALHFGFSLIAFTSVFLLTMYVLQIGNSRNIVKQSVSGRFKFLAWAVLIFTYCDIYLGAYVRHAGASLSCLSFPACNENAFIPKLSGGEGIQFGHRLAALILFILIVLMMFSAIRHYKQSRSDIYYASIIAFILTIAQIISGASVVLLRLNIFTTLSHSAIITCLFAALSYICVQSTKGITDMKK